MAAFLDLCRFTPTAAGTGDWIYSASVAPCLSPAAAGAVNGTVYKVIAVSNDLSQMEIAEGAYNSSTGTFARTTVLFNSSGTGTRPGQSGAGTKINFSTVPQVAVIGIKEDLISVEEANSFTSAQKTQARSNIGAAVDPAPASNVLAADVNVTSTSTFFDGPSVAAPGGNTGTFSAHGSITINDASTSVWRIKLWDGTTVIASTEVVCIASLSLECVHLSGTIANPAGNIRISAANLTTTDGIIRANVSTLGRDSIIIVERKA